MVIYTLSDSLGNVRYIGKTSSSLSKRLVEHLSEVKSGSQTHKCRWIRKLLSMGDFPVIEVLQESNELTWRRDECYWIEQFKNWGFKLTNLTAGGDGMSDYVYSDLHKISLAKAHSKITLQYDLNGKFINSWSSAKLAAEFYNISASGITTCCRSTNKTFNDYIWTYYSENYLLVIPPRKKSYSYLYKKVYQYDVNYKLVNIYNSIKEAASVFNVSPSNISRVIKGDRVMCKGYIWRNEENKIG